MNDRSVNHSTFVIERNFKASPARVFAAFEEPAAKAKWFGPSESFEFRVGGREVNRGGPEGGPIYTYDALYQEIVPGRRIVYSYIMDLNDVRISVSVATLEMVPAGEGTRLILTEQGAFLDGHDTAEQREHGTKGLLDLLAQSLEQE